MCNPTVAMVAISAASAGLQYKMGKAQQEAAMLETKDKMNLQEKMQLFVMLLHN